jgi:hypothetical protein
MGPTSKRLSCSAAFMATSELSTQSLFSMRSILSRILQQGAQPHVSAYCPRLAASRQQHDMDPRRAQGTIRTPYQGSGRDMPRGFKTGTCSMIRAHGRQSAHAQASSMLGHAA